MKISVRRPKASEIFGSFLGLLDIKLGAEIILLFGLINKVAGLYGLITVLVGGSFVQLLYYAYSTGTLFALLWGLRVVKSESAHPTLLLSHLYALDHLIVTIFHYIFYLTYWYSVPHDGRRTINSQAQQDLIDLALSRGEIRQPTEDQSEALDELRVALAGEIWEAEKGFAVWTLVIGWFVKIYFILILYSYAAHLASSTYHTLPLTARGKATQIAHPSSNNTNTSEDDLQAEIELQKAEQEAEERNAGVSAGPSGSGSGSGLANGEASGRGGKKKGEDDEDFSWD
ncbi:hypothetical protein CI109_101910 [Kwoniella shandongensis]|uniref:Uncharacterized protein n=1 Tax=Kwoniella shandongensis TaxID=1734106 RepID=A0A5M6BS10_9TREE|nr:uncharacterized protein CI109_006782 [Kwoniella shandongensis]KAA5524911.1 hypothetical protein CI109_006782 [Kwoniella shandongensis]